MQKFWLRGKVLIFFFANVFGEERCRWLSQEKKLKR